MNTYIKNLIILVSIVILFGGKTSFAENNQIILKGGDSFGNISFKKESPGKVFFKDKLLFEGIESYDKNSPRDQIEEVSIIVLKKKLHVTACCYDGISDSYLVDPQNGQLNLAGGLKYSNYIYLTESKDGKYAVLADRAEGSETGNEYFIVLLDIENIESSNSVYSENGIPQNFKIDNNYQFSFEDKSGIVKGDLLDFFKKDPDVNVPTNNGVINTTEVPTIPSKGDGFNPLTILILPCLIALAYFIYKKLKKKI